MRNSLQEVISKIDRRRYKKYESDHYQNEFATQRFLQIGILSLTVITL